MFWIWSSDLYPHKEIIMAYLSGTIVCLLLLYLKYLHPAFVLKRAQGNLCVRRNNMKLKKDKLLQCSRTPISTGDWFQSPPAPWMLKMTGDTVSLKFDLT